MDDTGLLAIDIPKLQHPINTLNEKGKEYGMIMNMKKTNVMIVSKKEVVSNAKLTIEGRAIEQVNKLYTLAS